MGKYLTKIYVPNGNLCDLCVSISYQSSNSNRSPDNINHHRGIRLIEPRVDNKKERTRKIEYLKDNGVGLEFTIAVECIRNDHLYGTDPTDDFDKDLQAGLFQGHTQHQAVVCNEQPFFIRRKCSVGTRRFELDLAKYFAF